MHFVDDVHFILTRNGRILHFFAQITHFVYAIVGRSVNFGDVQIRGIFQGYASGAFPARRTVFGVVAIDCRGKNFRDTRFPRTARSAKQIGVSYPARIDLVFEYRNDMYSKKQGEIPKPIMRHPYHEFGYEADDMLYWALWNPEKGEYERLSYLEARKRVYVPKYAKLVADSDAFKWMKSLLDQGKKIALLDFDGFNYYCEEAMKIRYRAYVLKCKKEKRPILKSEKDFTDIKDMKSAVGFAYTPVGHAFVVKALLQGDIEVVDGKVIDHIGMIA